MATIGRMTAIGAFLPMTVAVGAVAATYATGLTGATIEAAVDSPYLILGYFAEKFPALGFVVILAITRLFVVALGGRRPHLLVRLVLWPAAAALVLAFALYPTFGGFVVRPAMMGGWFSFSTGVVAGPQSALIVGGAVAGGLMGLVVGIGRMMVDWSWAPGWGKALRAVMALGAYAFLGAVIAWGWAMLTPNGVVFPRAPMTLIQAIGLVGLIILAASPQAALAAFSDAARRG